MTLTEQDYRWLESMKVAIESPTQLARVDVLHQRNTALEIQNAALWAHIDELTRTNGFLDERAETWRRRWARCFGVILVEIALGVVWMIAHYGR